MTYLPIILAWLKDHWKDLGYPLAAVFAFLWIRTPTCPKQEQPVATVTQAQAVTQTAKASGSIRIVYRDREVVVPGEAPRPLPCPDVSIDFGTEANQANNQAQAVTVTPVLCPQQARNALFIGGGYLAGPTALGGYSYGPWRVYGQANLKGEYGGGLTGDFLRW